LIQSSAAKPVAEIAAPSAFTVHADCSRHPSRSGCTVAAKAAAGNARTAIDINLRFNMTNPLLTTCLIHSIEIKTSLSG
jgi:hypothetical protein